MYIEFPHAEVKIEGMEHIEVPGMLHIRQRYDPTKIDDLAGHLTRQLEALPQQNLCGKRIAVTAGSRGIPHIALLYRTVCAYLRRCGAEPFLVPAMGSHGGGTAEGQTDILAAYGLTEESVGAPIRSCMDVVEYGRLDNGTHLYCDRLAAEADGIVVMNKVKPRAGISCAGATRTVTQPSPELPDSTGMPDFDSAITSSDSVAVPAARPASVISLRASLRVTPA